VWVQHLEAAGLRAAVRAADREQRVGFESRDRRQRDRGGEGLEQISSVHCRP